MRAQGSKHVSWHRWHWTGSLYFIMPGLKSNPHTLKAEPQTSTPLPYPSLCIPDLLTGRRRSCLHWTPPHVQNPLITSKSTFDIWRLEMGRTRRANLERHISLCWLSGQFILIYVHIKNPKSNSIFTTKLWFSINFSGNSTTTIFNAKFPYLTHSIKMKSKNLPESRAKRAYLSSARLKEETLSF